jgi:hypothetical protein
VNRADIRQTLLLYWPVSADTGDPQIAEALAMAKLDSELARWLEAHCAWQVVIGEKLRQNPVPKGL